MVYHGVFKVYREKYIVLKHHNYMPTKGKLKRCAKHGCIITFKEGNRFRPLHRAYIKEFIEGKLRWKAIGWFCTSCKDFNNGKN